VAVEQEQFFKLLALHHLVVLQVQTQLLVETQQQTWAEAEAAGQTLQTVEVVARE
jgi:hypothetical protein